MTSNCFVRLERWKTVQVVHRQALTKMTECFVQIERLSPRFILEKTQPRSIPPDLPDVVPEGMSIIVTDTGVWSTRFLPKGTEFGPYDHSAVSSDSFADGLDWTSSLRKSSGNNGHNMEAVQPGSKIFYKIVTDIQPQTELILLELKSTYNIDETDTDSDMLCQEEHTTVTTKHSSAKPHECKQCGKFFSLPHTLKQHMTSHTGVKSHKCSECGKLFSQRSNMKTHMVTHTKEKAFQCIECGKEFRQRHSLLRHMLTHSDAKPLQCKQCGKFFSRSDSLKQHITSHTGVKSHKCSECGKLFSACSNMKRHMLTHTMEKAFQCMECGKEFRQKQDLLRHMFIHSGEKHHECTQCGKSFSRSGHLKQHMPTHTGVKSHKCNECGKLFSRRGHMKRHMLTHTKEKVFRMW